MTRIAVVGGTSALARHVIPALRAEGHEVVTLGRRGCDVSCDLLNHSSPIRIPDATGTVIHLAAAFGGPSHEEVLRTVETNAIGTLRICVAAQEAGVKHIVLLSSIYAGLPADSPQFSLYALTKRHAEELAQEFCARELLMLTVLRPSPLYGEEEAFRRHQPFLFHLIDRAERGLNIDLFGTRDALRNYLHASDLARIICGVVAQPLVGVFSCTFPKDQRVSEIANAALRAFNRGGCVRFNPEEPDIDDKVYGNNIELFERVGRYPLLGIEEGMRLVAASRGKDGK